jgi:hypothetical protein
VARTADELPEGRVDEPRVASRFASVLALGAAMAVASIGAARDAHSGLYGDGPLFVELWRQGIWVQAHFLLLPLAIALRAGLAWLHLFDRAQAIRGISFTSTVLGAGCTQLAAARVAGPLAALLATLVLLAAPACRFYSGAVEVHALALACAAIATAWILRPASTRARARAVLAAGAVLCAASHVTLFAAALPLWLLHLDAERRAGRATGLRAAAISAVWTGGALLGLVLLVLALDRIGAPAAFAEYSAIEQYRKAMVAWDRSIPRPGLASLFVLEVLAPLGVLPWLALPGVALLLRRRPWLGSSCLAWFALLAAAALKVGAREHGAYVLPAGVALSCAAAFALRACARSTSAAPLAWLASAIAAQALALRSWAAAHGLSASASASIGPWPISRAELGLGSVGFDAEIATLAAPAVWWGIAVGAAIAAAWAADRRRAADPPRSIVCWSAGLVACGALALQVGASEAARARWPAQWHQELVDVASSIRRAAGEQDVVIAFAPNPETKWTMQHFLAREWLDLGELDGAPVAAQTAWITDADARIASARAAGARAYLPDDALALLLFDAARRPRAFRVVQRWLEAGEVERLPAALPFTTEYLRAALPAAR